MSDEMPKFGVDATPELAWYAGRAAAEAERDALYEAWVRYYTHECGVSRGVAEGWITDALEANMSDFIPSREQLDKHKQQRLAQYPVRRAWDLLTADECRRAIIEQLGDAELYQERLRELEASNE